MKKQIILIFIFGVIVMSLIGCSKNTTHNDESTNTKGENIESLTYANHTIVHKTDDLTLGVLENLVYNDGYLTLKDDCLNGLYTSPAI